MIGLEYIVMGWLHLAAAPLECQARGMPRVSVHPAKSTVQYDFSKSQAELDGTDLDTVSPYGPDHETHVGGLMSGEITVQHQVALMQEKFESVGQGCLHYDAIRVDITIDPTVYVASEYPEGGCAHKAVLEHEKKHIEVDRAVVNKYSDRIGKALTFALNKYGSSFGPFPIADIPRLQTKLQKYVDEIIKGETAKMNAERKALQQQVDSLEEYERVKAMCPETR